MHVGDISARYQCDISARYSICWGYRGVPESRHTISSSRILLPSALVQWQPVKGKTVDQNTRTIMRLKTTLLCHLPLPVPTPYLFQSQPLTSSSPNLLPLPVPTPYLFQFLGTLRRVHCKALLQQFDAKEQKQRRGDVVRIQAGNNLCTRQD